MKTKKLVFVTIVNFHSLVMNTKRAPLRACVKTTILSPGVLIKSFLIFDVPAHAVSGNQNRKTNAVKKILLNWQKKVLDITMKGMRNDYQGGYKAIL